MIILRKLLSFLWRGWFILLASICTILIGVFIIIPLCFREKDFPKAYFFMRVWSYIVFYGSGLTLVKHQFQDLSSHAPYFVIANHTSMMDIMVMFIINKNPMAFVGKKELEKLPIFGFIFKRLHILVDRKDHQSRKNVLRESIKRIKQGKSICIFPEGGVPDASVYLDNFKDGAFVLSIMNNVPLVTITICGLKKILPYAYFEGGPGKVHVYLNSIEETHELTKQDIEYLKDKSRKEILATLKICESSGKHY